MPWGPLVSSLKWFPRMHLDTTTRAPRSQLSPRSVVLLTTSQQPRKGRGSCEGARGGISLTPRYTVVAALPFSPSRDLVIAPTPYPIARRRRDVESVEGALSSFLATITAQNPRCDPRRTSGGVDREQGSNRAHGSSVRRGFLAEILSPSWRRNRFCRHGQIPRTLQPIHRRVVGGIRCISWDAPMAAPGGNRLLGRP